MEINTKKKFVAGLSIFSNVVLSILKITVGLISGSLSIISEAIHSMSDLFASVLTLFSVMKSSKPADNDHPYGHGKYEDMSGFIEGLLIIFASLYIVFEATKKIIFGTNINAESSLGIAVMLVAVILNVIVSTALFKVAKQSNSISLYADAQHLNTDIYSSFGVLAGLVLIKVTGFVALDSVIALIVALIIFKTGCSLSKSACANLLDHSMPDESINEIKAIIAKYNLNTTLKEGGIKARRVGPAIDIDIILKFSEDTTICHCHQICDEIEAQIQALYPNCSISIHPEPVCYQKNCQMECSRKKIKEKI